MRHVVIVDDDRLNLELVTEIVDSLRDTVARPFSSSTEALKWCDGRDVDCFILDYQMPSPDGIEMIRIVRTIARFALVPIVILTGSHEREVRRRALRAGANDFIEKPLDYQELVSRVSTLLALQDARQRLEMNVASLESSLVDAEARSSEHAERLEALWHIVNNPILRDEELLVAMLRAGASAIRPGQVFHAFFSRWEGSDIVIEASHNDERDEQRLDAVFSVGQRVGVADGALSEILPMEAIRTWDDVLTDDRLATLARVRELGWRSLVQVPFKVGAVSYSLTFASFLPTEKPFSPQDYAYAEILASLFATHIHQRWQAERMQFQLQHDSLTGLFNRVQFRTAGRAALRASANVAVAIVDIDRLRDVNAAHGHIIGDAILVEVAAALAAQALYGEIVARVGGDSFAVLLPSAQTRQWTANRLTAYQSVFAQPFSTGDREGKETVPVSATIGAAVAPEDGANIDELLLRAEAVTIDAKAAGPGHIAFFGEGCERISPIQ